MQPKKSELDVVKQNVVPTAQTTLTPGNIVKPTVVEPVDMISMLSQITVKVPLSKLFRIEEHKNKALSWLGGIANNNIIVDQTMPQQTPLVIEDSGIIS